MIGSHKHSLFFVKVLIEHGNLVKGVAWYTSAGHHCNESVVRAWDKQNGTKQEQFIRFPDSLLTEFKESLSQEE